MPGLSFDDSPTPGPSNPLILWLDDWVPTAGRSRHTVHAFVSDVELVAVALCEVVGKPLPALVNDPLSIELACAVEDVKAEARTSIAT